MMINKYVITEEQWIGINNFSPDMAKEIFDHPLRQDIPTSKELLLLAHTDFKNREERKGLHDQSSWVSGWIAGFLSERKPRLSENDYKKFQPLIDAVQEFVDRCDRGEVRSVYTYNKFRGILKNIKGEIDTHSKPISEKRENIIIDPIKHRDGC
jgi:hypothetical protein